MRLEITQSFYGSREIRNLVEIFGFAGKHNIVPAENIFEVFEFHAARIASLLDLGAEFRDIFDDSCSPGLVAD